MSETHATNRQRGSALVIVLIVAIGLLATTLVSFQMSRAQSLSARTRREVLLAREIAQSAASEAFVRVKKRGIVEPCSGSGPSASWVDFSNGQFYYYTDYSEPTSVSTVRAWGRVPYVETPSECYLAPDAYAWDGEGWELRGLEVTIQATKYVPMAPLYIGNGGIESPAGGAVLQGSSDPKRPETWGLFAGMPTSFQDPTLPFTTSALNHPADFLINGGSPEAALALHPYNVSLSQNLIGQHNMDAWFANSAGPGKDPKANVTPSPTGTNYVTVDKKSRYYPFAVDPHLPDVQAFAWELWNKYKDDPSARKLSGGELSGVYGDVANPEITFITGELIVRQARTFEGAGILVIRDAFDPNLDTDNQPSTQASLTIRGAFRWTGLVIVVGWGPSISVSASGSGLIVGALFGEDSVQSGDEVSLDAATIALKIVGSFEVLFSKDLFLAGTEIYDLLPEAEKKVTKVQVLGN